MRHQRHNKYKQGVYKPQHPDKYDGVQPVLYRSALELLFYKWCDKSSKVITWGSETVVIPYVSPVDGRVHRYYVDVNLTLQTPKGPKKYLIEIKPLKQVSPPSSKHNRKRSTIQYEALRYAINESKWTSARQWCEKNDYVFQIVTEKDITTQYT